MAFNPRKSLNIAQIQLCLAIVILAILAHSRSVAVGFTPPEQVQVHKD